MAFSSICKHKVERRVIFSAHLQVERPRAHATIDISSETSGAVGNDGSQGSGVRRHHAFQSQRVTAHDKELTRAGSHKGTDGHERCSGGGGIEEVRGCDYVRGVEGRKIRVQGK